MKVLVTGGAGFVGFHVTEELLKYKYQVVIVDNCVTGFHSNVPENVRLYEMDINDVELETVFDEERPDFVIHLAAQASVVGSMNDPYYDFLTNTVGTIKVMLLSKKYNVKKLIFASSAGVYGEPNYLPINETHTTNPLSFYALSKYSAENYIKHFHTINELESCILRFSNVYGPRQNENGEAGVVSIFINRLLANEKIYIYDGSQTRDFIYVKDVASACRLALENGAKGTFNISSCTETGIEDLYYKITKLTGINTMPSFESKRVGEIEKSLLDNRRALNELDWHVQYTLPKGLQETVQYYSEKYSKININV